MGRIRISSQNKKQPNVELLIYMLRSVCVAVLIFRFLILGGSMAYRYAVHSRKIEHRTCTCPPVAGTIGEHTTKTTARNRKRHIFCPVLGFGIGFIKTARHGPNHCAVGPNSLETRYSQPPHAVNTAAVEEYASSRDAIPKHLHLKERSVNAVILTTPLRIQRLAHETDGCSLPEPLGLCRA